MMTQRKWRFATVIVLFFFYVTTLFSESASALKFDIDDCRGIGVYEKNHDLANLLEPGMSQYLSAINREHSSICFSHHGNQSNCLSRLMLVWHSQKEIPVSLAVKSKKCCKFPLIRPISSAC